MRLKGREGWVRTFPSKPLLLYAEATSFILPPAASVQLVLAVSSGASVSKNLGEPEPTVRLWKYTLEHGAGREEDMSMMRRFSRIIRS
jgi:hypothetical protein